MHLLTDDDEEDEDAEEKEEDEEDDDESSTPPPPLRPTQSKSGLKNVPVSVPKGSSSTNPATVPITGNAGAATVASTPAAPTAAAAAITAPVAIPDMGLDALSQGLKLKSQSGLGMQATGQDSPTDTHRDAVHKTGAAVSSIGAIQSAIGSTSPTAVYISAVVDNEDEMSAVTGISGVSVGLGLKAPSATPPMAALASHEAIHGAAGSRSNVVGSTSRKHSRTASMVDRVSAAE